jgi:hypothetical protein
MSLKLNSVFIISGSCSDSLLNSFIRNCYMVWSPLGNIPDSRLFVMQGEGVFICSMGGCRLLNSGFSNYLSFSFFVSEEI